jgi:hypothetical protein
MAQMCTDGNGGKIGSSRKCVLATYSCVYVGTHSAFQRLSRDKRFRGWLGCSAQDCAMPHRADGRSSSWTECIRQSVGSKKTTKSGAYSDTSFHSSSLPLVGYP